MDARATEAAFRQAGKRAEEDIPDEFFKRTGLEERAFLREVVYYCGGVDPAGTVGDIVVGYHLAKLLDEREK